jgi:hypothetical protein
MISAAMLTAVSSGVRAPRSRPTGLDSRDSSVSVNPASRSRSRRSCVATATGFPACTSRATPSRPGKVSALTWEAKTSRLPPQVSPGAYGSVGDPVPHEGGPPGGGGPGASGPCLG